MEERRHQERHRTLKGGKIVFNNKKCIFDCLVRDLSPSGACLQVNSSNGLPQTFDLLIDGESAIRPCRLIWLTDTRAGIEFDASNAIGGPQEPLSTSEGPQRFVGSAYGDQLVRDQLLTLRVALDLVPVGIVLLDANTRAQFINRAGDYQIDPSQQFTSGGTLS